MIGRNTADPARWKRYRGGTAGHLWIDATGGGAVSPPDGARRQHHEPDVDRRAHLLPRRTAKASATSTRAGPTAATSRRHTDHDDFYARHAQTDGKRIVYQCGAQIWLFDPRPGPREQVPIDVPSHRTQAARNFVARRRITWAASSVHPRATASRVDVRGKLFTLRAVGRRGAPARHRRRRAPSAGQWLADGATLVAVSDASGEERVAGLDGRRDARAAMGRRPRGHAARRAARQRASPSPTTATRCSSATSRAARSRSSTAATTAAATTSPGRPTAPGSPTPSGPIRGTVRSSSTTSPAGARPLVTQPDFRDYAPAFDPEGRYLYFLSIRTFDPVYDSVQFELSFPRAARPYLIALQAGGRAAVRSRAQGPQAGRPVGPRRQGATARASRHW